MIKVIPLGVNGAFTNNFHNNYIFDFGERKLLIDAGTTLRYSLRESTYKESDITDIFITHLHSDHVGGLEEFAQRCKWIYNHKPNLWVRFDIIHDLEGVISKGLFTDGLWWNDYFDIRIINDEFKIEDNLIEVINTDNLHCRGMKSNALVIYDKDKNNIIFSSDIKYLDASGLSNNIDGKTMAVMQDCSIIDNNVHSTLEEILKYYDGLIEREKLYMMHYQDDTDVEYIKSEYGVSFVEQGKVYDFYN